MWSHKDIIRLKLFKKIFAGKVVILMFGRRS